MSKPAPFRISPDDAYCLMLYSYNVGSYRYAHLMARTLRAWLEGPHARRWRAGEIANVLEIERAAEGRPNKSDPIGGFR
jgi:hypothetical protein